VNKRRESSTHISTTVSNDHVEMHLSLHAINSLTYMCVGIQNAKMDSESTSNKILSSSSKGAITKPLLTWTMAQQ
jgi:hypothetical protein